jgi:hypothetical protein
VHASCIADLQHAQQGLRLLPLSMGWLISFMFTAKGDRFPDGSASFGEDVQWNAGIFTNRTHLRTSSVVPVLPPLKRAVALPMVVPTSVAEVACHSTSESLSLAYWANRLLPLQSLEVTKFTV